MADKGLNDLLKWSINASTAKEDSPNPSAQVPLPTPNADAIAALLGGPSDADLMVAAMENITSPDPEVTLESRITAFDNLEQLIESLDNANLLSKLSLWTPLLELLAHDEKEIRRYAAWVVGTAVQNNAPSQERLVALGGVEKLVAMALGERLRSEKEQDAEKQKDAEVKDVRRKAVYAISSAVRNYQPAMDVLSGELEKRQIKEPGQVEATDMDAVDVVIDDLREKATTAKA